MGYFSISLAHTGSIPHIVAARGQVPDPSNKEPSLSIRLALHVGNFPVEIPLRLLQVFKRLALFHMAKDVLYYVAEVEGQIVGLNHVDDLDAALIV